MKTYKKYKININSNYILVHIYIIRIQNNVMFKLGFPGGSDGKESACNAGRPGFDPGSGRSLGEGNGYPLQYSCLEIPMDRGAWRVTVYGVAKGWTQLSQFHSLMLELCKLFLSKVNYK